MGGIRQHPQYTLSSPATGSAEWPPDDRLRRVTQYSRDGSKESRGRGVLDARLRGHDDPAGREIQSYATLSRNASSAAWTASGVPTCIQTPSSRKPNIRSCSLARSNILVSENSPTGASANSDGDMIAAPA